MTLEQLPPRTYARIESVHAGWGLRRRLEQMGLHTGDVVSVVARAAFHGPVLVLCRGIRTALGRGVARRIEVVPVPRPGDRERTDG